MKRQTLIIALHFSALLCGLSLAIKHSDKLEHCHTCYYSWFWFGVGCFAMVISADKLFNTFFHKK